LIYLKLDKGCLEWILGEDSCLVRKRGLHCNVCLGDGEEEEQSFIFYDGFWKEFKGFLKKEITLLYCLSLDVHYFIIRVRT